MDLQAEYVGKLQELEKQLLTFGVLAAVALRCVAAD
jgi:hypothetical protein